MGRKTIEAFHDSFGLTFFDPACGCGNFLIIAYRELRRLEIDTLKELHGTRQRERDVATSRRSTSISSTASSSASFPPASPKSRCG